MGIIDENSEGKQLSIFEENSICTDERNNFFFVH